MNTKVEEACAAGANIRARADIRVALLLTLTLTLCYVPHVLSNRVILGWHGFFHSSIVYNIINTGIPPQNPVFAGETIKGYWPFHYLIALITKNFGIHPAIVNLCLNILSLIGIFALIWRLSDDFYDGGREIRFLVLFFLLFSMNALAPCIILLRVSGLVDMVLRTGWAESVLSLPLGIIGKSYQDLVVSLPPITVHQLVSPSEMGSLYQFSNIFWDMRLQTFIHKFMADGAFGMGLFLFAVLTFLSLRIIRKGPKVSVCTLFTLSAVALFYIHAITAVFAFAAIAMSQFAAMLCGREGFRRISIGYGVPWLVAAALCVPFYLHLRSVGISSDGFGIDCTITGVITPLAVYGAVIPFMAASMGRWIHADGDTGRIFILSLGIVLLGLSLFVKLPGGNEYKATYMLAIPVAFMAGEGLALVLFKERWEAKRRVVFIGICGFFLANPVLEIFNFLVSPQLKDNYYSFEGASTILNEKAPLDGDMFEWIKGNTRLDSRFLVSISLYRMLSAPGGRVEDPCVFTALTERNLYTATQENTSYDIYSAFPSLGERRALKHELFSCDGNFRVTLGQDKPFYVLLTKVDRKNFCDLVERLERTGDWKLVKRTNELFLYEHGY